MNIIESLNIKKHCAQYKVGLWGCPQFLFVLMGVVICSTIFAIYIIGQRFYDEPEIVALTALFVTAILFIIGHVIVSSFEQVTRASRAKSEFISIMSHELRSPLSVIKWQIDVLLSSKPSPLAVSAETARYLKTIDEQNERMIQIVNDLLEVNRIEDADLVLHPLLFSLEELTRRVVSENQQYASLNNLQISIDIHDKDTVVFADNDRIKRVMDHLIDNAIRYSSNSEKIEIVIEQRGQMICWKITNNGVGIMPEERDRIFEKFFRSPSMARYQTEGAGVGLFIAKSIITMSGGSIWFKSFANENTFFWFTLPRENTKTQKFA